MDVAAQAVREWLGRSGVADEVRDYAADTASGLLEDMSVSCFIHCVQTIYTERHAEYIGRDANICTVFSPSQSYNTHTRIERTRTHT